MTESIANIVEKWDFSHQKFNDTYPEPKPAGVITKDCHCFEAHNVTNDGNVGKFCELEPNFDFMQNLPFWHSLYWTCSRDPYELHRQFEQVEYWNAGLAKSIFFTAFF